MEGIQIQGIIRLHAVPDWSEAEFAREWQRMRVWERRARQVLEVENLITNVGMTTLLTQIGATGQASMQPFAQIFSVGNGAIANVQRTDTAVAGDGFGTNSRKVPVVFSISGLITTITTYFASGDAQGTWTNAGYYGYKVSGSQNATNASGTGALMSHALFSFVKGAAAYVAAYTFTLSN